ncbi:NAD(P)/FAD-dependent oxidoreductase [Pectinatus brassicae]|uniref:Thioredoxin reductase (NADPH) n=2 Tax=Pectinatus brassicae TaxID=862415 RepID=A0A840UTR4_9FIRM|nr:FAD-dependent oxidoreductase [Pectinatus brassicae]MBB5336214.1 thioredoxin reductase (NADPH) [Pectinatus brassicae]
MENNNTYDIVIIGGGPAGMTAAIYASRAGLKAVVLEADAPGGKLVKTFSIENWPGIKTVNGADLAWSMYEQTVALCPEFVFTEAVDIIDKGQFKTVICKNGKEYQGRVVIIASGTIERLMNILGEQACIGKGISFCAVCDSAFYKDKEVIVVGGGNSALEESIYLTRVAKKVTIIIRRDVFRADESVQQKVLANDKIEVIRNKLPQEVLIKDGRAAGLKIKDANTGEMQDIYADGIFPYIGNDPITNFAKNVDITDDKGYIVVDNNMATKVAGIYGAGDVCKKFLRQIVTAVNDGAIAVQAAEKYLETL